MKEQLVKQYHSHCKRQENGVVTVAVRLARRYIGQIGGGRGRRMSQQRTLHSEEATSAALRRVRSAGKCFVISLVY